MPQIQLSSSQKREFRSIAHHLNPIVLIGNEGLSAAVTKEVNTALNAHGLIKVRVFFDDRKERENVFLQLTEELEAAQVQHIGKLLVLWRPKPEKIKTIDQDKRPAPREYKVVKPRGVGQKPEIKRVQVLGNQRLTAGGNVKRARKSSPVSIKKGNRH